jgi:hypothetical protein
MGDTLRPSGPPDYAVPVPGVALAGWQWLTEHRDELAQVVASSSRFARLIDLHVQIAANLLFVRFELSTGDASGHNMVTNASDRLMDHILGRVPGLRYESVSGNFCSDKRAIRHPVPRSGCRRCHIRASPRRCRGSAGHR